MTVVGVVVAATAGTSSDDELENEKAKSNGMCQRSQNHRTEGGSLNTQLERIQKFPELLIGLYRERYKAMQMP